MDEYIPNYDIELVDLYDYLGAEKTARWLYDQLTEEQKAEYHARAEQ